MIRADGIDILVDLAGHTAKSRVRVFAHKPAPVQVTYLGYPSTTGLTTVDYRLTDAIADPPGEESTYTEDLFRLPAGFCCFTPPPAAPDPNALPAPKVGYVTFASLHALHRLNPAVLDLWCSLLRALPAAHLLVFRHTLQGQTKENLRRQLTDRGIEPNRIDLRQGPAKDGGRYLDVYHDVDIALDTFPWSGHTTSCEALWMGVPVITLRGKRHAGRMVSSVLTQLGLQDLIAETPEQYLEIAVKLANDLDHLATLRTGLRERMKNSPLCDCKGFTRSLEVAYRQMWRKWCETGNRPDV
jgi:predicted O-linked N-acetylglucosamine transferase (SPINDLY family)